VHGYSLEVRRKFGDDGLVGSVYAADSAQVTG